MTIEPLCRAFGLQPATITPLTERYGRSLNTVFRVMVEERMSRTRAYTIKVHVPWCARTEVENRCAMLAELAGQGVDLPVPLTTANGTYTASADGRVATMSPWIPGRTYEDLGADQAPEGLLQVAARYHAILAQHSSLARRWSESALPDWPTRLVAIGPEHPLRHEMTPTDWWATVARFESDLDCLAKLGDELPLHGDIRPANVVAAPGRGRLIDWDLAQPGPGILDLASGILWTAWRESGLDRVHAAVATYLIERAVPSTSGIIEALPFGSDLGLSTDAASLIGRDVVLAAMRVGCMRDAATAVWCIPRDPPRWLVAFAQSRLARAQLLHDADPIPPAERASGPAPHDTDRRRSR